MTKAKEGCCDRCKRPVIVRENVSGRAYYNCQACGWGGSFKATFGNAGSARYLAALPDAEVDDEGESPVKSSTAATAEPAGNPAGEGVAEPAKQAPPKPANPGARPSMKTLLG